MLKELAKLAIAYIATSLTACIPPTVLWVLIIQRYGHAHFWAYLLGGVLVTPFLSIICTALSSNVAAYFVHTWGRPSSPPRQQ